MEIVRRQGLIIVLSVWIIAIKSQSGNAEPTQFRSGDIIIGGLAVVHNNQRMVGGTQLVEIINMMIDEINRNETILPGVNLGSLVIDTRRTSSHTLKQITKRFFPLISKETNTCSNDSMYKPLPLFAGVIGSSTSGVSMDSAKLLQAFTIPQISYWSTSSTLSDKKEFPYFFRTISSDTEQADAIVEFAAQMRWNYVSFVFEDSAYGLSGFEAFTKYAAGKGICISNGIRVSKVPEDEEIERVLNLLKEKRRARGVVLYVHSTVVQQIMTRAKSDAEIAEHFIWIVTDTTVGILPKNDVDLEKYESELRNAIGFAPRSTFIPRIQDYFTNLTINDRSNSTLNPWFAKYISVFNNCTLSSSAEITLPKCRGDDKIEPLKYKQYIRSENVVNAFLMFTHAIDKVHREVCRGKRGICDDLKAMSGTSSLAELTYRALKQITITDVNGQPFTFDKYQDPPHHYSIYTYDRSATQSGISMWTKKGQLYAKVLDMDTENMPMNGYSRCSDECKSDEVKIVSDTSSCCWTCRRCEKNQYIMNSSACGTCDLYHRPNQQLNGCEKKEVRYFTLTNPYAIVLFIAGLIGTLASAIVTAIFMKFRNSPIVKASGKELCFYSLIGIALSFMNTFAIMSEPTSGSCVVACLMIAVGPTMMHAALLVKTIRVVIIFRSKQLSNRIKLCLQPQTLILFTSILIFPQIIIIGIWMGISNVGSVLINLPGGEVVFQTCNFLITPSIAIPLTYPFLITIACTVLATMNRNVPTGFNEAKLVGFAAYATTVVWLAFAATFGANQSASELKVTIVSLCVTLNAYAVLICLFVPRSYSMIYNPESNTKQAVMESQSKGARSNSVPGQTLDTVTGEVSHKQSVRSL